MQVRPFQILVIASAFCTIGCAKHSANVADYVGEYVYSQPDHSPGPFASFIVLKRDMTSVEVRYNKTSDRVSITNEKWDLRKYEDGAVSIGIGDFSHGVDPWSVKIHLLIEEGTWYEKIR
jgi:hypothetical protein